MLATIAALNENSGGWGNFSFFSKIVLSVGDMTAVVNISEGNVYSAFSGKSGAGMSSSSPNNKGDILGHDRIVCFPVAIFPFLSFAKLNALKFEAISFSSSLVNGRSVIASGTATGKEYAPANPAANSSLLYSLISLA